MFQRQLQINNKGKQTEISLLHLVDVLRHRQWSKITPKQQAALQLRKTALM